MASELFPGPKQQDRFNLWSASGLTSGAVNALPDSFFNEFVWEGNVATNQKLYKTIRSPGQLSALGYSTSGGGETEADENARLQEAAATARQEAAEEAARLQLTEDEANRLAAQKESDRQAAEAQDQREKAAADVAVQAREEAQARDNLQKIENAKISALAEKIEAVDPGHKNQTQWENWLEQTGKSADQLTQNSPEDLLKVFTGEGRLVDDGTVQHTPEADLADTTGSTSLTTDNLGYPVKDEALSGLDGKAEKQSKDLNHGYHWVQFTDGSTGIKKNGEWIATKPRGEGYDIDFGGSNGGITINPGGEVQSFANGTEGYTKIFKNTDAVGHQDIGADGMTDIILSDGTKATVKVDPATGAVVSENTGAVNTNLGTTTTTTEATTTDNPDSILDNPTASLQAFLDALDPDSPDYLNDQFLDAGFKGIDTGPNSAFAGVQGKLSDMLGLKTPTASGTGTSADGTTTGTARTKATGDTPATNAFEKIFNTTQSGFTDIANDLRGVSGVGGAVLSDPRFKAFSDAQKSNLDEVQKQRQASMANFFGRRGLSGTAAASTADTNLNAAIGREKNTLDANLGLQELQRQDTALLNLGNIYNTQAQSGLGVLSGQIGAGQQLLGNDLTQVQAGNQAKSSNLEALAGGLQNLTVPTTLDISNKAALTGGVGEQLQNFSNLIKQQQQQNTAMQEFLKQQNIVEEQVTET